MRERGVPAVGSHELAQAGAHEQRRRCLGTRAAEALNGRNDFGVEAEACAEGEPMVHVAGREGAEADATFAAGPKPLDHRAGRLDRFGRQAKRAGEDVRITSGDDGQPRCVGADPGAQQAGHHFVDGAVATDATTRSNLVGARLFGEIGRVPPGVGLGDVDLQLAAKCARR